MGNNRVMRKCPVCGQDKLCDVQATTCSMKCGHAFRKNNLAVSKPKETPAEATPTPLEQELRKLLKGGKEHTFRSLSEKLDRSEGTIRTAIAQLKDEHYNVLETDGHVSLSGDIKPGNKEPLIVHNMSAYRGEFRSFGACGDNHMGSNHERLDVLNALYDIYAERGVTEVFNTGNWIEGEFRLNKHDIKIKGMQNQVDYFIDKYPQRPGIVTYFVAGDDHEGWYQQRECFDIGEYAEDRAKRAGRDDLRYLGYVEADIKLTVPNGSSCLMKIMHPGGGSAYALSYASQKLVESFQGGEKPSILLYGHYHKFDYNYAREVHCIGTGCTVDQSIFMRKCKIQAHVGGTIVRVRQDPDDGHVNECNVSFLPFYDRGFYTKPREFGIHK